MTDKKTIYMVTAFLGVVILGGMAAIVTLTLFDKAIPDIIGNVTTTALGALGALLVSTKVDPGQLSSAEPSVTDPPKAGAARAPKPEGYVEQRLATDEGSRPRRRAVKS